MSFKNPTSPRAGQPPLKLPEHKVPSLPIHSLQRCGPWLCTTFCFLIAFCVPILFTQHIPESHNSFFIHQTPQHCRHYTHEFSSSVPHCRWDAGVIRVVNKEASPYSSSHCSHRAPHIYSSHWHDTKNITAVYIYCLWSLGERGTM